MPRASLRLPLLAVLPLMLLVTEEARAAEVPEQTERAPSPRPSDSQEQDLHAWGVEIEGVQPWIPTIHIFRMRGTRTLWGSADGPRGDLLLGFTLRPGIEHDVVETIHEYQAAVGYRQYLYRGLHLEAGLDVGAAWGTNLVDKKRYHTATLFLNTNVGYRFGFFEPGGFFAASKSAVGFYVLPQAGVYTSLGVADIGPRNGKPDVFLTGSLFLGLSF